MGTDNKTVLEQAEDLVHGERQRNYGDPRDNLGAVAALWTAYLGLDCPLTATDVCALMILLKQSRIRSGGYHRDSVVDTCGYSRLQELLEETG